MWFKDEELYPRFYRSVLSMTIIQSFVITVFMLFLKVISWHPFSNFIDFFLSILHWKTIFYQCMLAATLTAFGLQNVRFCAVEKHISSTRFERIRRALSLNCLQHVITSMFLGGLAAYCYVGLFNNFKRKGSLVDLSLSLTNELEYSFITFHGCYTGLMFSLKYFICNLYHIKFSLNQESKVLTIYQQIPELLKEAFYSVLKAVHWYYLGFIVFGPSLKALAFPNVVINSTVDLIYYTLLHPKLLISAIVSGIMISFIWGLYIIFFNAFASARCVFPIKGPMKGDKKTLSTALKSNSFGFIKYLAVLDLRILAQHDASRRGQIYAISNPGGHPHEWNAISKICIGSLQDFVSKLYEYAFSAAAADSKSSKTSKIFSKENKTDVAPEILQGSIMKAFSCVRQKPVVAYFLDELPNAQLMKLFASSLPVIWIIDALAYLVVFSYTEDKYGVVQQSLPDIIRLLLDLKMAEEKMPVGLVGIRTYVKDPQGRYEHIHQRLLLKTTVHNSLCRIASTFKDDIKGIYLPEDYQRYFQRYLNQKT